MDQSLIDSVTRLVRSFLPRYADHESIALDIIIESWQNKVENPSRSFIRFRCHNALRQLKGEEHMVNNFPADRPEKDHSIEDRDHINRLVKVLTTIEKKIIAYRFYMDLPVSEIAKRMKVDAHLVRQNLETALFKMRQSDNDE